MEIDTYAQYEFFSNTDFLIELDVCAIVACRFQEEGVQEKISEVGEYALLYIYNVDMYLLEKNEMNKIILKHYLEKYF